MPIPKLRLSQTEAREYRTRLLRLKEMGIEVGCDGDFLQEPERFRQRLKLEQVNEVLAKIYDLPGSGTIVVVHAKLTVVTRKVLITDFEMTVSWDELPLSLDDPERTAFYRDVTAGLYPLPLTVLNRWLTGESALCHSQREGVIIASGQRSLPSEYHDHTQHTVKLYLWDELDNELPFTFRARVDRSVKRKYERRERERGEVAASTKRVPMFEVEDDNSELRRARREKHRDLAQAALHRLQAQKKEEERTRTERQARVEAVQSTKRGSLFEREETETRDQASTISRSEPRS